MKTFSSPEDCLDHALGLVGAGTALEFGVSSGATLRRIVAAMPADSRVVGFDSFEGLPEHWRDGFGRGLFATTPPVVPGAELVVGLYAETLPEWPVPEDIVLVHVDCDLYSSTRTLLDHIGPHLAAGTLVLFDEYHGYEGSEDHESQAWIEWTSETETEWAEIARGPEQLLLRIKAAS